MKTLLRPLSLTAPHPQRVTVSRQETWHAVGTACPHYVSTGQSLAQERDRLDSNPRSPLMRDSGLVPRPLNFSILICNVEVLVSEGSCERQMT